MALKNIEEAIVDAYNEAEQAVDARVNSNAHGFLRRDVANVCEYFQRQGIEADPLALADGLWDRFTLGEL